MELLYCIIGIVIGYVIGINYQYYKKPIKINEFIDRSSVIRSTQKQILEDNSAYLFLVEHKNNPYNGPLWLECRKLSGRTYLSRNYLLP